MTDPKTLIRRGLDKGQAISKNPIHPAPRLAVLAGLKGDLPAIKTLKSAVIAAHAQVEQIRAATTAAIEEKSVNIRAKYAKEMFIPGSRPGIKRSLSPAERKQWANSEIADVEKDVRAINTELLAKNMTAIREARAKLDLMKTMWSDPVRVLLRSTLASEERATMVGNSAIRATGSWSK